MADQTFNVSCGFFDAVSDDRTYYADDMNRPYKRLVANGVFATPKGTPSTDFAVTYSSGMVINVAPGEGIFADKWFENPSTIAITVPTVTGLTKRIDSVIIQVDKRASGRVGSIVYRTGSTSSNPVPPAINQTADVIEYRLANVAANGLDLNGQTAITDLRGSAECPWVTALIQQVDTGDLWTQYQAAYATALENMESSFTTFLTQAQEAWSDFAHNLSDDTTITPNTITLTSSYVASAQISNIPIGIASYDAETDALLVFINGFMAEKGTFWSPSVNDGYISLNTAIESGDRVDFICFKSIITADTGSVASLIEDLDAKVDAVVADTDWTTVGKFYTTGSDFDNNHHVVKFRKIGATVNMNGAIKGATLAGTKVLGFNLDYCPAEPFYFSTHAMNGDAITAEVVMRITSDGFLYIQAVNGTIGATDMVPVCTSWLAAGLANGQASYNV